jgi:transposase, IS5 family
MPPRFLANFTEVADGSEARQNAAEQDLFRMELVNLIDQRHELVKLASLIDWPAFEQAWGPSERHFRHALPCDPSSLVRWRQRIGDEGCEWLLEHSIKAAMSAGVVKRQSLDTVIVDTTVQPKAIAHPTDSRLLNRAREQLVAAAQAGIELRQSDARVGKAADAQAGRYAHARSSGVACAAR